MEAIDAEEENKSLLLRSEEAMIHGSFYISYKAKDTEKRKKIYSYLQDDSIS